jgi:hypothetical protein
VDHDWGWTYHDRAGSGYDPRANHDRARAHHDRRAGGIDHTAGRDKHIQNTNTGQGDCEEPRTNKREEFHRET